MTKILFKVYYGLLSLKNFYLNKLVAYLDYVWSKSDFLKIYLKFLYGLLWETLY